MKKLLNGILAGVILGAMIITAPVSAQTYKPMGESAAPQAVIEGTYNGKMLKLPVYACGTIVSGAVVPCSVGGGGAGSSDATAANQASQIAAEQAIQAAIGTVTASPTQYTMLDRLKTINTTLGSPLQAGGAVSISNTPTVNIGTISTLSTAALQTSGNSALTAIASSVSSATPSGSNIIGKVGIDQTTDGTTNKFVQGASAATGLGTTPTATTAAASCLVAKASAGNIYGASLYSSVTGWFLIFDATSAPADGAVTPIEFIRYSTADATVGYAAMPPINVNTGATICFSTTGPYTKTASATASISAKVK